MRIKEKICVFLACIFAWTVIFGAVALMFSSCNQPSIPANNTQQGKEYIEIQDFTGYDLAEALEFLEANGIAYELRSVADGDRNKVLSAEFEGYRENGLFHVEKGTVITVYGNLTVNNGQVIYLTFDDGPSRDNTKDIVDILKEYNAKATFFILGNRIREYDDRVRYMFENGHEIGCHSYSHDINRESEGFIYASTDAFISEIERFEEALIDVLGEDCFNNMPKLLRFPGGSYSNGRLEDSEVPSYIEAVHNKGYLIYDWTILTNDAATDGMRDDESYEEFYLRSLKQTLDKAKDTSLPLILLMHDQRRTKENLRAVLDYLVSEGYTFAPLSDCPEYVFSK